MSRNSHSTLVIKEASPPVSTEKIKHKYSAKDKAHKKLTFPVLTWARSKQISYDPEPTNDERVPDTSGMAKGEKENESDLPTIRSNLKVYPVLVERDLRATQIF